MYFGHIWNVIVKWTWDILVKNCNGDDVRIDLCRYELMYGDNLMVYGCSKLHMVVWDDIWYVEWWHDAYVLLCDLVCVEDMMICASFEL